MLAYLTVPDKRTRRSGVFEWSAYLADTRESEYGRWRNKTLSWFLNLHDPSSDYAYKVKFDTNQLSQLLLKQDAGGSVPLEVALMEGQQGIADTLLQYGAPLDAPDLSGSTLLHRALYRGDEQGAQYLIEHGADVNLAEHRARRTPLHALVAPSASGSCDTTPEHGPSSNGGVICNGGPRSSPRPPSPTSSARLHLNNGANNNNNSATSRNVFNQTQKARLVKLLMDKGADPNKQDVDKRTALHLAVLSGDAGVVEALLRHPSISLEGRDCAGHSPLWYALFCSPQPPDWSCSSSIPHLLKGAGADLNASVGEEGDKLLHAAGRRGAEEAGVFLTLGGAKVGPLNKAGETPLHCSCTTGLPLLTEALLKHGADPNVQTLATPSATPVLYRTPSASVSSRSSNDTTLSTNPFDDPDSPPPHSLRALEKPGPLPHLAVYKETPLHRAIGSHNGRDASALLRTKGPAETPPLNLELRDSRDLTPLGAALQQGLLAEAELIVLAGADISASDGRGQTYLHTAVLAADVAAASFLLRLGAHPHLANRDGETPLELCIHGGVRDEELLEELCRGAAKGLPQAEEEEGVLAKDPPLWQALVAGRLDIARLLIKHGADPDHWHDGGDGNSQTLLHRAIDENLEEAAVLLLESGCEVNSPRRPKGGATGDLQTPLHLCACWGLTTTALALTQHGAKLNAKDSVGKTPLHLSIEHGHPGVCELLLQQPSLDIAVRDKTGTTPFAAAMTRRNNAAAKAILQRDPKAAQQFDHKGHNFLHVAVSKCDLESVLFLLSIHVDLSTTTQDEKRLSPLHLATIAGSELLLRNLLLAGSDVGAVTPQKQTCLHLAALHDHSHLAPVLLENGVNCDALDSDLNNALHVAVKLGHVSVTRVLLTESSINATAVNLRGQNPLHLLACHQPSTAPTIAKIFFEAMPDYPIDAPDVHGNTALLLSYQRGGAQLCRVLVSVGASLGPSNEQGENLFNSAVASRALLASLLDSLAAEPPWAEGDHCMECATKFTLATRRHHCRHCGRLLCAKCSDKLLPILKFGLNKPVRVCHICSQVLTLGPAALA
ncbi:Ankyrin repeat [Trinorchestia longiramus]|nr:Ankyrin repeat [Trinorchestia longiramus]